MSSEKADRKDILERLEGFRIESAHSNACYRIPRGGSSVFLKIYGPKRPRAAYEIRKFLGALGVRQPVEYTSPRKRMAFEEVTLRCWRERGYAVPVIVGNPMPELSPLPLLATTFIEGMTLREAVRDPGMDPAKRRACLERLFSEVARRHDEAFRTNEPLLFHIDANSRNILFAGNSFYHVDFEMGRPWEPLRQCASREVLKMLVTLSEDLEPDARGPVMRLFRECYRRKDVYQWVEKSITGRPFQVVHRYSSRKRKKRHPGTVTLYDLIEYLVSS
ncbi:MAG: hypothetical protein JXO48_09665 [Deltaproteobacteria bacterium]|nr:hypothetical protein [Deltaproteobacteria bacterium]